MCLPVGPARSVPTPIEDRELRMSCGHKGSHAYVVAFTLDVLVVEDDDDVRSSCADVLRLAGYWVEEAEDGYAALEHLQLGKVGVMLLDIYMPRLGGLELLDLLTAPPPVALLTSHEYNDEVLARRSKVTVFMQKPVLPEQLLNAVAQIFES